MADLAVDCVVTHHMTPAVSGVVRFNQILAERLGVPLVGIFDPALGSYERPLLSFKVGELSEDERRRLDGLLDSSTWRPHVFLHEWSGDTVERRLVGEAAQVWCGSDELAERVEALNPAYAVVWTPGLLTDRRAYPPAEISVFSFGMAHKLRVDMFERLRELLDATGRSYAVYISTATHETRSVHDSQVVADALEEVFPVNLFFLGTLSDVAVYNQLRAATFFAAFFQRGARANNTSVAAAMELGSVVITNLDRHSPRDLVHMGTVIDIDRCEQLPTEPRALDAIAAAAASSARARGWDVLTARIAALEGARHR